MVHRIDDDWKTLDEIWLSDGNLAGKAKVQARVSFAKDRNEDS
ncbi:MAG: hypothetical protein AAF483_04300 [Planctomycetota bacterium]